MFLGLLMAVSCTQTGPETINEIKDHYSAPANAVVLTTLAKSESQWLGDKRLFNLSFSGDGVNFETVLVGFDALLAPGQYILVPENGAKSGDAITEKTKVGGKAATGGYVTVSKNGNEYQISASLKGVDPAVLTWKGSLPFASDPEPIKLTQVISAQSNLANNVKSLTMQLGTDGISQEFDWTTFQTVWKGEGAYLAIDIYSEDGYLHEGNYTPCAKGGEINPGEFGIGYDTEMEFGGQVYKMENWGTCWWTVKDGAATAEKILGGLITVTKLDNGWQISWGQKFPVEAVFNGEIPALTKPDAPAPVGDIDYVYTIGQLQPCILNDNVTVVDGVMKNPVLIADKAGNQVANIELVLATGNTELEGEYVSTEYAHEAGQLANGYFMDLSAMGWGIIEGGSWYMNGSEKVYIDPGKTVTVKKLAKGAYQFSGDGFNFAAAGPDYEPGDTPGPGPGDFDGVSLTKLIQFQNNIPNGSNLLTLQFATDGVSVTTEGWSTVYTGSGNYLALDIYATSEVLAEGTYNACATGGVVGEGEFGIGYDTEFWGMQMYNWGTCWWTVDNGQTSAEKILDGTVVVEKNGDNYTLTLKSSVVNARYVGPIAAL